MVLFCLFYLQCLSVLFLFVVLVPLLTFCCFVNFVPTLDLVLFGVLLFCRCSGCFMLFRFVFLVSVSEWFVGLILLFASLCFLCLRSCLVLSFWLKFLA